jgi:glycosyltransferase involved in cell wall biosynthesis
MVHFQRFLAMSSPEQLCVVIPAFREAERIGAVVRGVRAQGLPVIVVDDGSPDATGAAAAAAGATVLRHAVNRGKGVALQTAYDFARAHGYAAVITMDGDGQHDPADLPGLLAAARTTGAPVVIGNRMGDATAMPRVRRGTNRLMSWLLSRLMRQRVPDTQCGFRYYQLAVLPTQPPGSARYAAESELLLDLAARGARFASAPVRVIYGGEQSKINPVVDTLRFLGMMLRRAVRQRRG